MTASALPNRCDPAKQTDAFAEALARAGIPCAEAIVSDGHLHRYQTEGDHNPNCWYVLHGDGVPAGAFGCWKRGISETWCAQANRQLTPVEHEANRRRWAQAKEQREADEAKRKTEAREKADAIWQTVQPATDLHPYLVAKGVKAHGLRLHEGCLVVPLRDVEDQLHSLQFIGTDGGKKYLAGGRVKGCCFTIGTYDGVLCIAEGYATAASIHEATGHAVAVAFNAGNLPAVAEALRGKYPEARIIVCADNDQWTEGNPGRTKAEEAVSAISGLLAVPEFQDTSSKPTDFNDLARLGGAEIVRQAIEGAKTRDAQQSEPTTAPTAPSDDEIRDTVARLARLSPIRFEQAAKQAAKKLGCSVEAVKKEVRKVRDDDEETGSGRPFEIKNPELWPCPVDGAPLLDGLAAAFRRFVVLPVHGDTIAALWTLHSYAFELSHITPILVIASPDKGCGKTTLRDVLAQVVRSALSTDGISAAALFRVIEKWRPTVLLDDFDSWGKENDELRGVLNTGYRRGGVYVRCVGEDSEPRGFATFAPKAINLIGRLHPTLHDRAIVITMRRKLRDEAMESLHGFDGEELRRKCARWVADNAAKIQAVNPTMPDGLFNRQADNWRPLLALADVVGGDWPNRARLAALAAITSDTDDESLGIMLLADIRAAFNAKGIDRVTTENLLEALKGMDERPWADFSHGKSLSPRSLSRLLKPFGIGPGTVRLQDGRTPKGYMREWFEDAFARYIPEESATAPQSSKTRDLGANLSATPSAHVADAKREKWLENKARGAAADTEPPESEAGDPGPWEDAGGWEVNL